MKFATIRELSSGTSQVLKEVESEDAVIITKFGKPRYILLEINEDEIEDFILAKHYNLEKEFERARGELKRGKTKSRKVLLIKGARGGR
ncbi:type II toxin-antitoxin system Phd/YefM family antitoxin [candidate division TA06 bacterium]|nr:type II toxin-antitoxin system Phd/YefM family antitoxin [candidate division TA06 bacterium]